MTFQSPVFASLLLLLLPLLLLERHGAGRRRAAMALFQGAGAETAAGPTGRWRRWRLGFTLLAVTAMVLALMRPQWGTQAESVQRTGRDLVIMLDVSQSMRARDVAPSRLARAKAAVTDLVDGLDPAAGHRLKLYAFAGRTALLSPFTDDHGLFLDRLAAAGPESVLRHGTLLDAALRLALQDVDAGEGPYVDVIMLSDGEDHGAMSGEAARTAAARRITVHTVGIGDVGDGALVPVPGANGEETVLLHDGNPVRSRLRPGSLERLAEATGGTFVLAGTGPVDLRRLYRDRVASRPGRQRTAAAEELPVERFQWFVAIAVLAWAAALLAARRGEG